MPDTAASTAPSLPDTGPRLRSRRVLLAFGIACGGALLALAILGSLGAAFVLLSWPHVEPLHDPAIGVNYDCNQAEYLLLEDPALGPAGYVPDSRPGRARWCADTLGTILRESGARYARISLEWWDVEPAPGTYDFSLVDALLAEAQKDGAKVLLGVGVKSQRDPEFYIPTWLRSQLHLTDGEVISDDPLLRSAALEMIGAIAAHAAASPAVEAWQADNEPYVSSNRTHNWTLSRDFVAQEVAAIRAADSAHRPVIITHAQHFVGDQRWQDALADGDVLGTSMYPYRNYEILGHNVVVPIEELGPIGPNYAAQARAAHADGKQFWVTELQAEPWSDTDIRYVSPENPSPNLTPERFRQNIEYGRRSGADRVYLWGAEWWLYEQQKFGDSQWMDLAHAAITASGADQRSPGG